MNSILQTTTFGLSMVIVFTTSVQAQSLQQPGALATTADHVLKASASEVRPAGCCDGAAGCCNCAGNCCCKPTCCPQRVVEEVEKKCWKVKSKYVCIPSFRWPWECAGGSKRDCAAGSCCGEGGCTSGCCNCPPKCGKVRCVNVLEQHKYKCKKCGTEWKVQCVRSGNRCSCEGDGCCPGCGCSAEVPATNDFPRTSPIETNLIRQVSATESQPTSTPSAYRVPLCQKKSAASLADE